MTPVMPDAPELQNRMLAPPQGTAAGGVGAPGMMAPTPPPASAIPMPSKEQIDEARQHLGAIVNALQHVASLPKGELTKKDVFEAASDMIAKGGFPTAASKQDLIVTLSKMPDDEPGLRAAIGRMLLRTWEVRAQFHGVHGTGEPPVGAAMGQAPGAPNAGV